MRRPVVLTFAVLLSFVSPATSYAGPDIAGTAKVVWGKAIDGQMLAGCTDKTVYAPGQRIVLRVCLKNVGDKDLRVVLMNPLATYDIRVTYRDGKRVPLTLFGKRSIENSGRAARNVGILKPGEETCARFELSRLFDLSLAGGYKITVEKIAQSHGSDERATKVLSNELELTVEERADRMGGRLE